MIRAANVAAVLAGLGALGVGCVPALAGLARTGTMAAAQAPVTTSAPPFLAFVPPKLPVCASALTAPTEAAALPASELGDVVGAVMSFAHPGVLWLLDRERARLFATTPDGANLGSIALPSIDAVDFEDLSAGACPDMNGPCLYVADTGNPDLARKTLWVYAVPEPDVTPTEPLPALEYAPIVWRFPLTGPGGEPVDISGFVVEPDMSAMAFYEHAESARIFEYRAPWTPEALAYLDVSGRFDAPGTVEGAAIHPSGSQLALRTDKGVYEVSLAFAGGPDVPTALHFTPDDLRPVLEAPAGKVVAYDDAGTGLFLVPPPEAESRALRHAVCAP